MSQTHTTLACKEKLCKKTNVNFYDFQLNSLLREYRKQEVLDSLTKEVKNSKNSSRVNKLNYLQDEFAMQIEESLDFYPKKQKEISFISLA